MTSKKYHGLIAIIVGSMLMTVSCNENLSLNNPVSKLSNTQQLTATTPGARLSGYSFDGTEGDPIAFDSATEWITNYTAKNQGVTTAHFFESKTLGNILSKNGGVGIRFYYAINGLGIPNLFAIGADSSGRDFSSLYNVRGQYSSVALGVTSSIITFAGIEADSVLTQTTNNWINNYISSHPIGIHAHFFGYEIIRQILNENGCVGIRCYYALNGSGVQQLLLVGVTSNGENLLPTSSTAERVTDNNTIADVSAPCPSYCSGS